MREHAGNARARFAERLGLVVRVRDTHGRVGLGEASPLPGHSPDTIDACEHELMALSSALERSVTLADIPGLCARLRAPAARFALETALLDLMARQRRIPLADLLANMTGRSIRQAVPICALIDPLSGTPASANDDAFDAALARVVKSYRRGIRCIKVKIGHADSWQQERDFLRAIRARLGHHLTLRLDVNGVWTPAEADEKLSQLAEFAPQYVEDPCADLTALAPAPVPLAVDQPLATGMSDAAIDALLASGAIAALVLKPMLLGGALRCLDLAARAESRGVRAIISHLLDGPIAFSAYAQIALLLDETPGLDDHAGLSAWPALSSPHTDGARIRYSARHGLGLGERALFAARDQLSIHRCARQQPRAIALITAERALTREQLRARVDKLDIEPPADLPGLLPIVAERTVDTAVQLLYALEQRIPAVLLPARAGPHEHARQRLLCRSLAGAAHEHTGTDSTLALVLFTSGSRGQPKGVLISRAALLASARASAENLGWRDDDRWLCALPLAHIGGLSVITRSLLAGRPFVLAPEGSFDPAGVAALMEHARVTLVSFVPTMLSRLLDIGWSPPAHLRAVLLGGAAAPVALLERARARGVPVLTTYGMTETCAQICTQPAETLHEPRLPGRVGKPLPGVELDIRQGRIFVRGDMLFSGYLGAPTPVDEHGFFDTGDLGHLDADGFLWVRGRADETIITGGENVDPTEIEDVLLEHPDVRAACVFGVADATWGQIIAVVVNSQRTLVADDLAIFLQEKLPTRKRPRLWCQWPELVAGEHHKMQRARIAESARASLRPLSYRR